MVVVERGEGRREGRGEKRRGRRERRERIERRERRRERERERGSKKATHTTRTPRQRQKSAGTKRMNDSKPNESTMCSRMTKSTRARCKNRPLIRADGISPPTSLGELIAADNKVLNFKNESRNDHRNALNVQDEYSYWLQSYPPKRKEAQETTSCLRRLRPPYQERRKVFTNNSKQRVHESVSRYSMDA